MRLFKPSISACVVLLGVTVAASFQAFAQTPVTTPPTAKLDLTATAKADVLQAEQELAKTSTRVQQHLAPLTELSEAKICLAEARLQLAQVENQPETVIQQAQIIVDERTQVLAYTSTALKVWAASLSQLNATRLALAEARVNLELYTLLGIKRENAALALHLFRAGAAPKDEIKRVSQPLEIERIQTLLSTEMETSKKQGQTP